ncbi:hypothetical protein [Streptomyces sp. NPDC023327]|uniref:hypothetical protein n=1 Tax=Streptomyces sp. NPDC023327 TaxID=3157088 RepID=UPI003409F6B4
MRLASAATAGLGLAGLLASEVAATAAPLPPEKVRDTPSWDDGLTPVPCADLAVNTYLRDGQLPAADLTCPKPETRS